MSAPEIITERLRLSPLLPSDAQALFEYRSDPEVCRYQSFEPGSLGDALEFIAEVNGEPFDTPGRWFQLGIRLRESDFLVGDIGVRIPPEETRQAEIGITVATSHQGQGIGTEAVQGMLGHLLGNLKKHRVFASVDPRNGASVALLERVGMRKEAHFRESLWFKSEWVDDVVFGILESEWGGR